MFMMKVEQAYSNIEIDDQSSNDETLVENRDY